MPGAQAGPVPCNEREINMLAIFMLALHALCRALADLLPGADIRCCSWGTGMVAAVPGKSPDPILDLSLEPHAGGAANCRWLWKHGPAPP